jgi:uncharacterized NAD(P)/FAD-binding protein YdhS
MMRRRIAIVGAGFSGVVLAAQLLARPSRRGCDVVLIDRSGLFGPGLAYRQQDKVALLNACAADMSALADAPNDFVQWLRLDPPGDGRETFAPRWRYGDYLSEVLRRAQQRRRKHRLQRIAAEAIACRPCEQRWRVEFSNREAVDADAVVLALGNIAAAVPPVLANVPVVNAWEQAALKRIPKGGDILLLGAGLTMLDAAVALAASKTQGVIYASSRRGLAPRPQTSIAMGEVFAPEEFAGPLSEALHAFRRHVRMMAERGEPWQRAMDALRPASPTLWARLTVEQQRRFLRHLRPWWDVHRHRAPPQTHLMAENLVKSGRLRLLAGEVVAAAPGARGIEIMHRQRGSYVRHRMELAAVVNCTGAALDVAASADPLIAQLRDEGLARPHPTGLGFDVSADGRLIDRDGRCTQGLLTLGPPAHGAFWENIAVPEIRNWAQLLAESLIPPV